VAHLADRDVRGLSGGEAQRVSLARALAVEPRVLLLDEPFTGLDATTRADLLADLRAVLDHRDTATLLVTHDRAEARALADRSALLVDGRIRAIGPTERVLDEPVDAATAHLLGFTNLLPPALTGAPHPLAARPEDCALAEPGTTTGAGAVRVTGTLRRTVALGPVLRVDLDTTRGPLVCLLAAGTPTPPAGTVTDITTADTRPLPPEEVEPDPGCF
jgi:ABC-type sulfate/molybdate transport systems ATPase subunit